MVKINGTPVPYQEGQTVEMLLADRGYDKTRIAVERNGEILPKTGYAGTQVADGDRFEVVSFVGGG